VRTTWDDLPGTLREAVEVVLGGRVVDAASQAAGFSPGSADRVVTADGRRAFVKTLSRTRNPHTFGLHERELAVMRGMPPGVPAPALLGSYLDGEWIALVLEDIDGHHPRHGRHGSEVGAVLDAIAALPVVRGRYLAGLPDASLELSADALGWSTLVADDATAALPAWVRDNLRRLECAAVRAGAAVEGDHLVHLDCRADNILVDDGGRAWIVDWPWAAVGAAWLDGLTFLLDTRLRGENVDCERVLREHELFADVRVDEIDAVLSAITGMFFDKARHPAPPNMPTIRAFQRREGLAGAEWLRERWA